MRPVRRTEENPYAAAIGAHLGAIGSASDIWMRSKQIFHAML